MEDSELLQSSDITIRIANSSDSEFIEYIQKNDGFRHHHYLDRQRIARLMSRGEAFFLAYTAGQPIGFTAVDYEEHPRLHFLSVLETFHRKGVGSQLLTTVVNETKNRGFQSIHVFTEVNSPVEKILTKFNFKKAGRFQGYYEEGRDANIWMLKV